MRIIPAIDIIEGKCVRLTKGDYATKKIYNENPLEVARQFEHSGIRFLHLVDLDGAKSNRIVNYKVLETIASGTSLQIDFGGGIKRREDLEIAFSSGASQVTGGSIAARDPELFKSWLFEYGPDKIILGADVKQGHISINGWQETTELDLFSFVNSYMAAGLKYAICTDISKDGMLEGPAFELYSDLIDKAPGLQLIASGGISSLNDLVALEKQGCEGAIIGKALYENKINLKELEQLIIDNSNAD